MTLADRAAAYAAAFPDWPAPRTDGRWLDGVWVLGNDYRTKSPLYGAFPAGFLKRVYALFPEHQPAQTMFLFSGLVSEGLTIDIVPARNPKLVADCQRLPLLDQCWDGLIIADPAYSKEDSKRYGTEMPNRRKTLAEAARIAKPGTHLVWLDTVLPMFRKAEWHWWGAIAIVMSTNHRIRLCAIFTRK